MEASKKEDPAKLKQWSLGRRGCENVFLSIFRHNVDTHIFLSTREKETTLKEDNGIVMNMNTWIDFSNKIFNTNYRYPTKSFVANNSLCVFAEGYQYMLQNLQKPGMAYKLNSNCLQMSEDMMKTIKKKKIEIDDLILSFKYQTLLTKVITFLKKVYPCNASSHSEEFKYLDLFECICYILDSKISKTFICNGCIVEHPSQRQHPCFSNTLQKFTDEDILMTLDVYKIGRRFVDTKCTCHFDNIDLDMDSFPKQVRNALQLYERPSCEPSHKKSKTELV